MTIKNFNNLFSYGHKPSIWSGFSVYFVPSRQSYFHFGRRQLMFPLFELVRLLSVKDDHDSGKSPVITHFAWKEAGEVNILALSCNNGENFPVHKSLGPFLTPRVLCSHMCTLTYSFTEIFTYFQPQSLSDSVTHSLTRLLTASLTSLPDLLTDHTCHIFLGLSGIFSGTNDIFLGQIL